MDQQTSSAPAAPACLLTSYGEGMSTCVRASTRPEYQPRPMPPERTFGVYRGDDSEKIKSMAMNPSVPGQLSTEQ